MISVSEIRRHIQKALIENRKRVLERARTNGENKCDTECIGKDLPESSPRQHYFSSLEMGMKALGVHRYSDQFMHAGVRLSIYPEV